MMFLFYSHYWFCTVIINRNRVLVYKVWPGEPQGAPTVGLRGSPEIQLEGNPLEIISKVDFVAVVISLQL